MISAYQETPAPEVGTPVAHGEDEPNKLALVGRQGAVAWRHWTTEEGHRVLLLQQDRAEPMCGCITLDHKGLAEVG